MLSLLLDHRLLMHEFGNRYTLNVKVNARRSRAESGNGKIGIKLRLRTNWRLRLDCARCFDWVLTMFAIRPVDDNVVVKIVTVLQRFINLRTTLLELTSEILQATDSIHWDRANVWAGECYLCEFNSFRANICLFRCLDDEYFSTEKNYSFQIFWQIACRLLIENHSNPIFLLMFPPSGGFVNGSGLSNRTIPSSDARFITSQVFASRLRQMDTARIAIRMQFSNAAIPTGTQSD